MSGGEQPNDPGQGTKEKDEDKRTDKEEKEDAKGRPEMDPDTAEDEDDDVTDEQDKAECSASNNFCQACLPCAQLIRQGN